MEKEFDEINQELSKLVSDARDERKRTGGLKNFFKIWDDMDIVEQENLVAFLIEEGLEEG